MKPYDFQWPVRVYYEDTDSGGVVYHAIDLNYFSTGQDRMVTEYGF